MIFLFLSGSVFNETLSTKNTTVSIVSCSFIGCVSSSKGGGLCIESSSAVSEVAYSYFNNCSTDDIGGGIFAAGENFTVVYTCFAFCYSPDNGAAARVAAKVRQVYNYISIYQCDPAVRMGSQDALYGINGLCSFDSTNSSFNHFKDAYTGLTVADNKKNDTIIKLSTFISNYAKNGGTIYYRDSKSLFIEFCNFINSSSGSQGLVRQDGSSTCYFNNNCVNSPSLTKVFVGGKHIVTNCIMDRVYSYCDFPVTIGATTHNIRGLSTGDCQGNRDTCQFTGSRSELTLSLLALFMLIVNSF